MCDNCREAFTLVNKDLTEHNFRLQFLLHLLHQNQPTYKYISMYSIYINTAVSFKSNITNIYYCWPPILDPKIFEKNICISDLLTILVCDIYYNARKINYFTRKGQFIKSGNFSISQGKLNSFRGEVTCFCISTEVKHIPSQRYCFQKLNDKQIGIAFPIRSVHSVLNTFTTTTTSTLFVLHIELYIYKIVLKIERVQAAHNNH